MNEAVKLFKQTPKIYNCAQAVVIACNRPDLTDKMAVYGGGRAPDGLCGALYAAMAVSLEEHHKEICHDFVDLAGSELCKELKTKYFFTCDKCVEIAASLSEKFG